MLPALISLNLFTSRLTIRRLTTSLFLPPSQFGRISALSHLFALLALTFLQLYMFTFSRFHNFTLSPFHPFTFSPFHFLTRSPFHLFTFSLFHLLTFSPSRNFNCSPLPLRNSSPFRFLTFSLSHSLFHTLILWLPHYLALSLYDSLSLVVEYSKFERFSRPFSNPERHSLDTTHECTYLDEKNNICCTFRGQ